MLNKNNNTVHACYTTLTKFILLLNNHFSKGHLVASQHYCIGRINLKTTWYQYKLHPRGQTIIFCSHACSKRQGGWIVTKSLIIEVHNAYNYLLLSHMIQYVCVHVLGYTLIILAFPPLPIWKYYLCDKLFLPLLVVPEKIA